MYAAEALRHGGHREEDFFARINYSTWLIVGFAVMAMAIVHVWSHINMTEIEYQIAQEITRKEQLVEEQKRLRIEMATLKSPQRIESIARQELRMTYPERQQVIILK